MEIRLDLTLDKVNKLCAICESLKFDVNVICGRVCVDGCSVLGVMEMCGRTVVLAPVTINDEEYDYFYERVKEVGAYKTEGFYG